MTTIDEIKRALELRKLRPDRMNFSALELMIAAALAEARRDGAREMREAAAQVAVCDWPERADAVTICAAIRALPLSDKREPVRLTDGEAMDALPDCHGASLGKTWLLSAARAIETAVLTANGLTK